MERPERFHPTLENKRVLFIDKNMFTPGFVSHMRELEKMKVITQESLGQIPNLYAFMETNHIDFAIIHNAAWGETSKIIDAVKKGQIIVVQEKNPNLELNEEFNKQLRKAGVKTLSRTEPNLKEAFIKCLDYLSTHVK